MTVTDPEIQLHDTAILDALIASAGEREKTAVNQRERAAALNDEASKSADRINGILATIGGLTADDSEQLDNALRALADARTERADLHRQRDEWLTFAEENEKSAADYRAVADLTRKAAGLNLTDTTPDGAPVATGRQDTQQMQTAVTQ